MLYFNKYKVMVLTDYKSIYRIIYHSTLNIISIDRVNCRFTNTLVYLSVYQLDIYYIPGHLNFISDTLLRLHTLGDDIIRKDNTKPVLDVF